MIIVWDKIISVIIIIMNFICIGMEYVLNIISDTYGC